MLEGSEGQEGRLREEVGDRGEEATRTGLVTDRQQRMQDIQITT